jgi:aryl-alcohol dehydrogenase-like predicted oxidoreductase
VIGMGTWKTFDVSEPGERRLRAELVREALRAGTTVFDSSPMYGQAEEVLGNATRDVRDKVFIATKVWAKTPRQAQEQITNSLRFFGGHIDLYQVHNLSMLDEVLPTLRDLKSTGQVHWVGVTHWNPSAFPDLEEAMGREGVDAVQLPYNAAQREVEARLLPRAEDLGLGILVMQPFGTGRLTNQVPTLDQWEDLRLPGVRTWAQVLLKWILSDPRVHVLLPATRKPGRPTENAEAGNPPYYTPEQRDRISQLALATA